MIEKAKRPVIYAGGGIISSDASKELLQFAERMNTPVTTTLMGITGFPPDHPLSLGMLGMHGTAYANMAVTKCDLLLAMGARFDDRVTGKVKQFAPEAKIIHIDIDPAELGKNVNIDLGIKGDVKHFLRELLELPQRKTMGKNSNGLEDLLPVKILCKGSKTPICYRRDLQTNPGQGHYLY